MAYIKNRKKRVAYAIFVAYPVLIIGFSVATIISCIESCYTSIIDIFREGMQEAKSINKAISDKTDE